MKRIYYFCKDCNSDNIESTIASQYFNFEDKTLELDIEAYKCEDCGYIWGYVL